MNITSTTENKKTIVHWNPTHDVQLTMAYIQNSVDPVAAASSSSPKLWQRILETFNEKEECRAANRSPRSLESRWQKIIQPEVNKFCECLAEVGNCATEEEKINRAKVKYTEKSNKHFAFEGCWRILSHHPKWMLTNSTSTNGASGNEIVIRPPAPIPAAPAAPRQQQASDNNKGKNKASLKRKAEDIKDVWVESKDKVLKIEEEKILLMKQSNEIQRKLREDNIMCMDLSSITDPIALEYFRLEQKAILDRKKAQLANNNKND